MRTSTKRIWRRRSGPMMVIRLPNGLSRSRVARSALGSTGSRLGSSCASPTGRESAFLEVSSAYWTSTSPLDVFLALGWYTFSHILPWFTASGSGSRISTMSFLSPPARFALSCFIRRPHMSPRDRVTSPMVSSVVPTMSLFQAEIFSFGLARGSSKRKTRR